MNNALVIAGAADGSDVGLILPEIAQRAISSVTHVKAEAVAARYPRLEAGRGRYRHAGLVHAGHRP